VALNAVLPARGGDAAKIALLRTGLHGSSVATIASTMSVIVLFDAVLGTVLVAAVAVTGALPLAPPLGRPGVSGDLHVAVAVGSGLALAVAAGLAGRRLRAPAARLWERAQQGGAILRTPGADVRNVAAVQAAAWGCRIGVVFFSLAAFGVLPVDPPLGAGDGALRSVHPRAAHAGGRRDAAGAAHLCPPRRLDPPVALAFSVGLQAGSTLVNAILGITAAMIAFKTVRPLLCRPHGVRLARGLPARRPA
jgi:hypothetical protein